MEENEVIKEIEHDDNCFWSYIGSFIGGIIGTIPWIVLYYLYSFNLPILPALIPIMAASGYKFFKGTVNSKTFRTIVMVSIIIFILTLYAFFPYLLSQKNNIEFKEFSNSEEYVQYSKDVLNGIGSETFFMIVGIVVAYAEISNLLKRYKSTNGMIKDSNLFIRRDDNPIDSEDYNGIRFSDEQKSPFKSEKIEFSNNRTTNQIKADNINYNKKIKISNPIGFIILFMFFFVIMPILIISDNNSNSTDGPYYNNFDNFQDYNDDYANFNDYDIDNDYDYDDNNENGYDYYNDYKTYNENFGKEYIFEKENIKVTIPDGWEIITTYNGYLYLMDANGFMKNLAIFNKEDVDEELIDFHQEMCSNNIFTENEINSIDTNINGNNAYYSVGELENGYSYAVYTMQYEDYYIVLLDYETQNYNLSDYNALLTSVRHAY